MARQGGERVLAGGEAVHEHERDPRARAFAQTQHLPGDHVEEAQAVLDLEQGLRAGHPHARPQAAVELEDHGALEGGAALLAGLREVVRMRDLGDRLDLALGQLAGVAVAQAAEVVREGLDGGLARLLAPHLLDALGQPVGDHARQVRSAIYPHEVR
jgi:hypothetical protein